MKICEKCSRSYADSMIPNTSKCSCGGDLVSHKSYKDAHLAQQETPRCPTCGSKKIRRISSTEKVTNAMLLGFFGNKRKMQFECLNDTCKYRW